VRKTKPFFYYTKFLLRFYCFCFLIFCFIDFCLLSEALLSVGSGVVVAINSLATNTILSPRSLVAMRVMFFIPSFCKSAANSHLRSVRTSVNFSVSFSTVNKVSFM